LSFYFSNCTHSDKDRDVSDVLLNQQAKRVQACELALYKPTLIEFVSRGFAELLVYKAALPYRVDNCASKNTTLLFTAEGTRVVKWHSILS
jgi:hypothetical protein